MHAYLRQEGWYVSTQINFVGKLPRLMSHGSGCITMMITKSPPLPPSNFGRQYNRFKHRMQMKTNPLMSWQFIQKRRTYQQVLGEKKHLLALPRTISGTIWEECVACRGSLKIAAADPLSIGFPFCQSWAEAAFRSVRLHTSPVTKQGSQSCFNNWMLSRHFEERLSLAQIFFNIWHMYLVPTWQIF